MVTRYEWNAGKQPGKMVEAELQEQKAMANQTLSKLQTARNNAVHGYAAAVAEEIPAIGCITIRDSGASMVS